MADSPDSLPNEPIFDKFGEDSETADTSITPASQTSPPGSPASKSVPLSQVDNRIKSRSLAASLSIEEQVIILVVSISIELG